MESINGITTNRILAYQVRDFLRLTTIPLPTVGEKSELPRFKYLSFLGEIDSLPKIFDDMEADHPESKCEMLTTHLFKHLNCNLHCMKYSPTGCEADVEFEFKLYSDCGE